MGRVQYLFRGHGTRNSAHYWNGKDTLCRLWSTGGMNPRRKWIVAPDPQGHPICTMCINVTKLVSPTAYKEVAPCA